VTRFKNKKISVFGPYVKDLFFTIIRELKILGDGAPLSREITFSHDGEIKTFMVYVTVMTSRRGVLVIVEDMSDLYKINKIKTWQEAAKQMAHEIKNPLASLKMTLQLLIKREDQPKRLEGLEHMLQDVERLQRYLDEMLEYAHPGELRLVSSQFNDVVGEVLVLGGDSTVAVDG